jgi:hypothetical protein
MDIVGHAAATDFIAFKLDWKGSRISRLGILSGANNNRIYLRAANLNKHCQ